MRRGHRSWLILAGIPLLGLAIMLAAEHRRSGPESEEEKTVLDGETQSPPSSGVEEVEAVGPPADPEPEFLPERMQGGRYLPPGAPADPPPVDTEPPPHDPPPADADPPSPADPPVAEAETPPTAEPLPPDPQRPPLPPDPQQGHSITFMDPEPSEGELSSEGVGMLLVAPDEVDAGSTFAVGLWVNSGKFPLMAAEIDLKWDAARLQGVTVLPITPAIQNAGVAGDQIGRSTVNICISPRRMPTGSIKIATLVFAARSGAQGSVRIGCGEIGAALFLYRSRGDTPSIWLGGRHDVQVEPVGVLIR